MAVWRLSLYSFCATVPKIDFHKLLSLVWQAGATARLLGRRQAELVA